MHKFKLAFGIHNHQPVGNFEHVFEEAHQKSYQPFLNLLNRFGNIRISLHQSGILWEWQEKNHPKYFDMVKKLIDRNQIELLTGGFYEPILSSIPASDAKEQICRLTAYLRKNFNTPAKGLWLTERIWEPHLPEILADAGVNFLPIDDTHFLYAGFDLAELTEPYITENEGKAVVLLPILKKLRYLIPFGTVDEVMNELRRQAERQPDGIAVYADDGEKFGVWPNTYKHCYEDKWLENFFKAVEQNSDWLEIIPLSEAANRTPKGRAYLPSASYEEMLHWSLPTSAFSEYEEFEHQLKDNHQWERFGRFVRGGHWRGFLSKYEESNLMHKKMLHLSKKLSVKLEKNPDDKKLKKAQDKIFSAQCNCPYWHGVFGGLYLPHIRKAIYSNLVEAEKLIREATHISGVTIENTDCDYDGQNEILVSNEKLSSVWKPSRGGSLLELSLFESNISVTDTLTRRREGYHNKLAVADNPKADGTASIHDRVVAKEKDLDRFLIYDWYLKRGFIDHFFGLETKFENFSSGQYTEEGDFILEPYQSLVNESSKQIIMTRYGSVHRSGGIIPITVKKQIDFNNSDSEFDVTYSISSAADSEIELFFAVENNFNFQAGHADDRYILVDGQRAAESYLDSIGAYDSSDAFAMIDEYQAVGVGLILDTVAELWHLPIFTVSLSEGGFERVYQGTTFVHGFKLTVKNKPIVLKFKLIAGSSGDLIKQFAGTGKAVNV